MINSVNKINNRPK